MASLKAEKPTGSESAGQSKKEATKAPTSKQAPKKSDQHKPLAPKKKGGRKPAAKKGKDA